MWHLTSVLAFRPSPWPRPSSPWPGPFRPWPSSSSRWCAASSACPRCCCWPCCSGRQATKRSVSCSDFSPYSRVTWSSESSALGCSPAPPSHPSPDPTEARIRSLPMPGTNYGRGARAAEALGGAVYSGLPQVERRLSVRKPGGWQAVPSQPYLNTRTTGQQRRRGRGLEYSTKTRSRWCWNAVAMAQREACWSRR